MVKDFPSSHVASRTISIHVPDGLKPRERLPEAIRAKAPGAPLADACLRFPPEEVKTSIDRTYPAKADRANAVIMESSMGGLIALHALGSCPQVFSRAAALSAHWPTAAPGDIPPDMLSRAGIAAMGSLSPGTGHDETAWTARLDVPLAFLPEGKVPSAAPGRDCGPLGRQQP